MKRDIDDSQDNDQLDDGSNDGSPDKKPQKRSRNDEEEVRLLIPSKVCFIVCLKNVWRFHSASSRILLLVASKYFGNTLSN